MAIPATRQQFEEEPVPALQLMPRLDGGIDGDGATLRVGPGVGWRRGLIALLGAVALTAAVVLVLQGSHAAPGPAATAAGARQLQRVSSRLAGAGAGAAAGAVLKGIAVADGRTVAGGSSAPVPHDLSSTDLTALAAGNSLYQPAGYLVGAYRTVGAHFHIPWRVIASLEYIEGDYVNALAGANSAAERSVGAQLQSGGRDVVNARVLAQATAATAQPSTNLVSDVGRLAADGATVNPEQGLSTYLANVPATPSAVLTLAQSIEPAATSASTPAAKVTAMLNEAHLLNGLPYVWGGGHTNPAWVVGTGYDCSGFVSAVLHSAGYLSAPDTTQTLPGSAGIVSGPGKLVTIYDRTIAKLRVWVKKKKMVSVKQVVNQASAGVHVVKGRHANSLTSISIKLPKWVGEWQTIKLHKLVRSLDTTNNDEHVIIDIDGQWWESGGSTGDGGAARVHQIVDPSRAYLASFNRILHPEGL
jgi:cell wall-associated NlpC family hydrolase